MSKTSRFTGSVTLYSTVPDNEGPKEQPVHFTAVFEDDGRWTVATDAFDPVILDQLDATLAEPAQGQFVADTSTLSLDAVLKFTVGILPSRLPLKLNHLATVAVPGHADLQGQAPDVEVGTCVLVASGTFAGGLLQGYNCFVQMSGRFKPNPWA